LLTIVPLFMLLLTEAACELNPNAKKNKNKYFTEI
jgi:hypothetical protein